jgi:hypothetical protein
MKHTGIPHEQEMPAPVTTTIRRLLTRALDKEVKARRVDASLVPSSIFNVVIGIAGHCRGGNKVIRRAKLEGGERVRNSDSP